MSRRFCETWVRLTRYRLTGFPAVCSLFVCCSESRVAEGIRVRVFARCFAALGLSAMVLVATGCGSGSSSGSNNQFSSFPAATVPLVKLSTDTFTNSTGQHATEVEPGSFSFGQTIITSFQVGRIAGGGAADIGFAISNDSGATWKNGLLPGLTTFQAGGTNSAVSDTSAIYDSKHGVWMISSLPISTGNIQAVVSRSTDGGASWGNPIVVAQGANLDKDWITCDNTAASPHYGNCYMEWDDNGSGNLVWMSTSSDGGLTWAPAITPVSSTHGLGAEQLVQPNGNVVAPFWSDGSGEIESFLSSMVVQPGVGQWWSRRSTLARLQAAYAMTRCPRRRWTPPGTYIWFGKTAASAPTAAPTTW